MKEQSAAKQQNEYFIGTTFGSLTIKSEVKIINKRKHYDCVCNNCNNLVTIRKDDLSKNRNSCKNCCQILKINNTYSEYINKYSIDSLHGNLKVLSDVIIDNKRKKYKCKCLNCLNISIVRQDGLDRNPKSCRHCKDSEASKNKKLKYINITKYNRIYNSYKGNAKSRNLDFKLSLQDVIDLVNNKCYYCHDINSSGIDRIDNTKGYLLTNVRSCCKFCNIAKNNHTENYFLEHIKNIYLAHFVESSTTIEKNLSVDEINLVEYNQVVGNGENPVKDYDIV